MTPLTANTADKEPTCGLCMAPHDTHDSECISMSERSFVNLSHLETILELDRKHEELLVALDTLDRRVSAVLCEVRAAFQPAASEQPAAGYGPIAQN